MRPKSLLSRLRNIWKLSEFQPRVLGSEPSPEGTKVAQLIAPKTFEPAQFIPRVKKDPVKAITEEHE